MKKKTVWSLLLALAMTVIVITHNQALTAMADRVIKIKNGKVESMHANPAPADVMSLEW